MYSVPSFLKVVGRTLEDNCYFCNLSVHVARTVGPQLIKYMCTSVTYVIHAVSVRTIDLQMQATNIGTRTLILSNR